MLNKRVIVIVATIILLYLGITTFALPGNDTTEPVITLNGDATMTINEGTTFVDPGAKATDEHDGDITADIIKTGSVDEDIPGSYKLYYNVEDEAGNKATEVTRTVKVVNPDPTAPLITLLGNNPFRVEVGHAYVEAGAIAHDDVDGDMTLTAGNISGEVNANRLGTYIVRYNIEDNNGNHALEVTRVVIVEDTSIPSITLSGNPTVEVEINTEYTDLGATADDHYYGDLTGNIVINNPVDTSKLDTYTITYNVVDGSGNPATEVTRTVIVKDDTAPVIKIDEEDLNVTLELNDEYTEPTVSATDNSKETILVNKSGTVDTKTAGKYIVTYTAKDSSGNNAIPVVVTVSVKPLITAPIDYTHELGVVHTPKQATVKISDTNSLLINPDSDTVNINKLDTYTLTYNYIYNDIAATTKTTQVTVEDTTPPTGEISYSTTEITNNPVIVTLKTSEIVKNIFGWTTSDNMTFTKEYSDNTNGNVTVTFEDLVGNPGSTILSISNIDKVAPSVQFNPTYNYTVSKSHSTVVTIKDLMSGINSTSLRYVWSPSSETANVLDNTINNIFTIDANGNATIDSSTVAPTGNWYLWVIAYDNVGNKIKARSGNPFVFDNTAPVMASVNLNGYNQGWTNSDVKINISATDKWFKVTQYQYSTDNGINWINTNSELNFTTNTNISIMFRAIDEAGNISLPSSTYVVKVDKTVPAVQITPDYNYTVSKSHSTVVTITDLISGINPTSLRYVWSPNSGSAEQTDSSINNTFTIDANGNATINSNNVAPTGHWYLWILGYDNAGNKIKAKSNVFIFDNTAPVMQSVNLNGYNQGWTNNDVKINISATDLWFKVAQYQYSVDNGANWINTDSELNYNSNTNISIMFRAIDEAGNISNPSATYIVKVDKTLPTVQITPDHDYVVAKSHSTVVTIKDLISGINPTSLRYVWSSNSGSAEQLDNSINNVFTIDANGNATIDSSNITPTGHLYLWILGYDNAGNKIKVVSNVFVFDNTAPVMQSVNLNGYNQDWTNSDVKINLTATDKWYKVTQYQYSTDNGINWINTNSELNYNSNTNISIMFRAIDEAGNISLPSPTFTVKIDKSEPNLIVNPTYVSMNLGDSYDNMSGVSATDNVGIPTITSDYDPSMLTTIGEHTIHYTATDSVGNKSYATRIVDVHDIIPPTITLKNDYYSVNIGYGREWLTKKYTVTDNYDKNVNVVITTKYVTKEEKFLWFKYNKTYAIGITYTATDSSGNTSTATYDFLIPQLVEVIEL